MEDPGPSRRPPELLGKGWEFVVTGALPSEPGRRYDVAVKSSSPTGDPSFMTAICLGPRSFQGISWDLVIAFRLRLDTRERRLLRRDPLPPSHS
jgi:hypothetical protein